MNRHLYTITWTQPYATAQLRPYLRLQQELLEQVIENQLEASEFKEAQEFIKLIKDKLNDRR